jgi:hypothetical protein
MPTVMASVRIAGALTVVLLLGALRAPACFAADVKLELVSPVARPGGVVGLKFAGTLDSATKVFVRLSTPRQDEELPVDAARIGRGRLQVTLPKVLRQGRFKVELMTETGEVLGTVPELKILATEPPTISRVIPHPSYPVDDAYSFELTGENFGQRAEDNLLTINDVKVKFESQVTKYRPEGSVVDCQGKLPCLVGNRRSLKVYGLSLTRESLYRPLRLVVQVDFQASAEHPLLLSWVQRSTPIVVAFGVLVVLSLVSYVMVRGKAASYRPFGERYSTVAYAFIDSETNTYSLSRLQLLAWTAAAVVAYSYVGASQCLVQWQWQLPKVPDGLAPLLGLSVGTTALAAGATEARGSKGAGPRHPGFGDFLTAGGALAPERVQFFIWTVLGVVGFLSSTLAQDPATVNEAAKIPDNFLPLMGVSSLGYIAGKVVRKPGPIIRQLLPAPPYAPGAQFPGGIRIVGENLSPRAMVWLKGQLIAPGSVTVPAQRPGAMEQSAALEFVTDLLVDAAAAAKALAPVPAPGPGPAPAPAPAAAAPAPAPAVVLPPAPVAPGAGPGGVAMIKIVNPDGQSAEI